MTVSIEGIALPDDIQWTDEFVGFGVGQTITPTIEGALIVEENLQPEGRAITLSSGEGSWVNRSAVLLLETLAATPLSDGGSLSLVWGNTTHRVVFDRSRGAGFEAEEVYRLGQDAQSTDHPYFIKLTLLIKSS
jgi:hypothetical protein